jgi:heme/copper-type cytochrome/quinol oxidase subunit 3
MNPKSSPLWLFTLSACLLFCMLLAFFATAQDTVDKVGARPGQILLRAARLLDPRTGNLLSPAAVLIEKDKIKQVGSP